MSEGVQFSEFQKRPQQFYCARLLFREEPPSASWDQDHQDFIIEARAVSGPTTIALLGLGGLFLRRRK